MKCSATGKENFASVKMHEWVTVCSHVKAVKEDQ